MFDIDCIKTRHKAVSPSSISPRSSPEVIKRFSCPIQLSMKFQLLIKTKIQTSEEVSGLSLSVVLFIMLINVKMPTIVGILTFMSRKYFVLSSVEHEKSFITSRPGPYMYM